MQHAARKSQNILVRIQYETDDLIEQKSVLTTQNKNLVYLVLGLIFIVLLLLVIRAQRSKNKILQNKHEQQKANEAVYNMMISQQNKIEQGRIQEKTEFRANFMTEF